MSLFEQIVDSTEPGARQTARILYRQEQSSGEEFLLVRSAIRPRGGIPGLRTIEESLPPTAGVNIAFRLAINAVERVGTGGTRPVPMADEELHDGRNIESWIGDRLIGALASVELIRHEREILKQPGSGMRVQIDTLDGHAKVEDSMELQRLLEQGVGRAKNYGCGLLTVKRV